jgi:cell division septation protein DedD
MALCLCLQPLVACTDFGAPAGQAADAAADAGAAPAAEPALSPDLVPAPAVFEATGTARWDGRRTLEGVWVAHPQASSARRVRIYNDATGAAADGALFTRDAVLTGPSMLISSDAARLLGIAPGEEAGLRVVAVTQRHGGAEALAAANPSAPPSVGAPSAPPPSAPPPSAPPPSARGTVSPPIASPVRSVPARAADGAAARATAVTPALTAAPAAPAALAVRPSFGGTSPPTADPVPIGPVRQPAAASVAAPAIAAPPNEGNPARAAAPAIAAAPRATGALAAPYVQAGLFAVRDNADRLIGRLEAAGLPALGKPVRLASGSATRVLAGPFATAAERDAARRQIQSMGLRDAIPVAR